MTECAPGVHIHKAHILHREHINVWWVNYRCNISSFCLGTAHTARLIIKHHLWPICCCFCLVFLCFLLPSTRCPPTSNCQIGTWGLVVVRGQRQGRGRWPTLTDPQKTSEWNSSQVTMAAYVSVSVRVNSMIGHLLTIVVGYLLPKKSLSHTLTFCKTYFIQLSNSFYWLCGLLHNNSYTTK